MYGILRFGVGDTSLLATPEIAQFALGDLTLKAHNLRFTHSSTIVNHCWTPAGKF
jgi:hypothetical protein